MEKFGTGRTYTFKQPMAVLVSSRYESLSLSISEELSEVGYSNRIIP
jgi:hypothetical protein